MAPIVLSANKQVTRESLRKQVETLEKELAFEKCRIVGALIWGFIVVTVGMFVLVNHQNKFSIDLYYPIIKSCREEKVALESRSLVVGGMWLW